MAKNKLEPKMHVLSAQSPSQSASNQMFARMLQRPHYPFTLFLCVFKRKKNQETDALPPAQTTPSRKAIPFAPSSARSSQDYQLRCKSRPACYATSSCFWRNTVGRPLIFSFCLVRPTGGEKGEKKRLKARCLHRSTFSSAKITVTPMPTFP